MVEARTSRRVPDDLLERDRELSAIDAALTAAADGRGHVVLIEGAAGSGKSALVGAARSAAERARLRSLGAVAGELEREYAFGCIRQLFEPLLRTASDEQRRALLAGAAAPAERIVAPDVEPRGHAVERFAALNALYWLTAHVAEQRPLLLTVDDLHWADDASIHALAYLCHRIAELPVALVIALRPQEPGAPEALIDDLRSQPDVVRITPRALTAEAATAIVRADVPQATAAACGACHAASAGNPLYLREMLRTMRLTEATTLTAPDAAARIAAASLPTLTARVARRVAAVGPDAPALATAMAVLGDGGSLTDAAELAGVTHDRAAAVARRLRHMEILFDEDPFAFVHPLVRRSVYDSQSLAERDAAHAAAARVLISTGSATEAVAAHLAACRPARSATVARGLLEAARAAAARGAPEAAVSLLRRALAEDAPEPPRPLLLFELSRAELTIRDPAALDHLRETIATTSDDALRVTATIALADALSATGQWDELRTLAGDEIVRGLGDEHVEVVTAFEAMRLAMVGNDPLLVDRFDPAVPRLRQLAEAPSWAAHVARAALAGMLTTRGGDPADVAGLAEWALADGVLLSDGDAGGWVTAQVFAALVCNERYERALAAADDVEREGRRVGSLRALTGGPGYRAFVADRRGDLRTAEAEIRPVIDLLMASNLPLWIATLVFVIGDTLLERPGMSDVVELIEVVPVDPVFLASGGGTLLRCVRGRLRLARGETDAALIDLRASAESAHALGLGPNWLAWRSTLALALPDSEHEQAVRLAAEELALARRIGLPRALGVALRATGVLQDGATGVATLRESVAVLKRSQARLEYARSLVELGSALLRVGDRAQAREQLYAGLELATACGAERLVEQARAQARAAGARLRRIARSGADALTASELRVARLAAAGHTNTEIAEDLFISVKTVETHLSHAYAKLGLHGQGARTGLATALSRDRHDDLISGSPTS